MAATSPFALLGLPLFLLCVSALSKDTEKPFIVVWNAPTSRCMNKHDIDIPVAEYGITENSGGVWKGDQMVIFYERELGLYPYLTPDEVPINGGIPQSGDLEAHLVQAKEDIALTIPDKDFSGYAVIDWENWRPMFDRNWSAMRRYQRWSRDLVRQAHPTWSDEEINKKAKEDFEAAARAFMEETLDLARSMRPKGRWGFYGFPRCYNNGGLTPNCSDTAMDLNDQLDWLYKASNAIYPSAYFPMFAMNETEYARNYFYGQCDEALRVKDEFCPSTTPVLVYTRYTIHDDDYYTKDLYDASLKMAAELGLHGAIIWGSSAQVDNKQKCQTLHDHINDLLGPYSEAVLEKAQSCSLDKCYGNGRCYTKDALYKGFDEDHDHGKTEKYLARMLDTLRQMKDGKDTRVEKADDRFIIRKRNGERNADYFCSCFEGWTGTDCSEINEMW